MAGGNVKKQTVNEPDRDAQQDVNEEIKYLIQRVENVSIFAYRYFRRHNKYLFSPRSQLVRNKIAVYKEEIRFMPVRRKIRVQYKHENKIHKEEQH